MEKFVTKTQMQTILDNRPKGVSMDDVINAYRSNGYKVEGIDQPDVKEPTLADKLSSRASNVGNALKQGIEAGKDNSPSNFASGATKMINAGASIPGQAIGAIGDVLGAGLNATGLDKPIATIVKPIVETDTAQKLMDFYHSLPQETQDLLGNATNIASVIPVVKGGQVGVDATEQALKATSNAVKSGVQTATEAVSPIVKGASDITRMAGESLARVPDRIKTNVAEKQAMDAEIKSLPNVTAQTAVRDGVDILDVKNLSNTLPENKNIASKLIQGVKEFASGKSKTDPIEIVGSPIVQGLKAIEKKRSVVGKELGEISRNLGIITKPELTDGVFNRISKTIEGITLKNGKLIFKDTVLANSPTEQKAIQTAFNNATKWGDGRKAHLYRQELFEILGGKKKSLENITDTQEKALNAIRAGLSDVLETKNPAYKALSNEYRKLMEPLSEMRKAMKNIDPNSSDDILNMSAGLLARRITSASPSNPQIRQILKSIDNVTKGTTAGSVEVLQDLYNTLNKYYDIAPKTGFQNLVKEGTSESATGFIKDTLRDIAGKSNAVRQKALEKLLEELIK
jgi:hypothetical protein